MPSTAIFEAARGVLCSHCLKEAMSWLGSPRKVVQTSALTSSNVRSELELALMPCCSPCTPLSGEPNGDAMWDPPGFCTPRGERVMLWRVPGVNVKQTGILSWADGALPAPFVRLVFCKNRLCFCDIISSWSRCILKGRPFPSLLRASIKW